MLHKVVYPLSRSTYSVNACTLKPDPSEWVKQCVCDTPMNPDENYILCEKCEKWYHYRCVFVSQAQADNMAEYFCSRCTGQQKPAAESTNGNH